MSLLAALLLLLVYCDTAAVASLLRLSIELDRALTPNGIFVFTASFVYLLY
jgi:hypothetical protein